MNFTGNVCFLVRTRLKCITMKASCSRKWQQFLYTVFNCFSKTLNETLTKLSFSRAYYIAQHLKTSTWTSVRTGPYPFNILLYYSYVVFWWDEVVKCRPKMLPGFTVVPSVELYDAYVCWVFRDYKCIYQHLRLLGYSYTSDPNSSTKKKKLHTVFTSTNPLTHPIQK